MVDADREYVERLISAEVLSDPVLELGSGYGGATCRSMIEDAGLRYFGTDLAPGPGVDVAADFEQADDMRRFADIAPFGSVLILNVLEHTFDPIRVLDNATTLVKPGGKVVVLTPSVWPLHNYPMDAWRILPNFYEEYARRRGLVLLEEYFEYVGLGMVADHRSPDSSYSFPPPTGDRLHSYRSRLVHKVFNTFGRSMFQPSHIACAAVFSKEPAAHARGQEFLGHTMDAVEVPNQTPGAVKSSQDSLDSGGGRP